MRFLSRQVALQKAEKRLAKWKGSRPKFTAYCSSGSSDYPTAARLITESISPIGIAELVLTDFPFGDAESRNHPGWVSYYKWRRKMGEFGTAYELPGHELAAQEESMLTILIEETLQIGCDATLFSMPGRHLMRFFHDDRIEILGCILINSRQISC
jgi:hypothetical protein